MCSALSLTPTIVYTQVFSSAVVPDRVGLTRLAGYVDAGKVRPVVDRSFDGLESAVEAFEYLETGHAKGKVLIRISAEPSTDL